MKKIGAWVYNPQNSLLGDKKGRSALYEVFCEDPEQCDLYTSCGSCLLSGISSCKFGRKTETSGYTSRARGFHSWMREKKEQNKEYIGKLKQLNAYNRIFKAHGSYYIPYAHMSSKGFLSSDENPIKGKWISEEDMTPNLLATICTHNPRSIFGDVIKSYQKTEVVKFIWDLKKFYPDLFDMLPEEQKDRASAKGAIGRKADITTMPPCKLTISKNTWTWDGEYLVGSSMLFQPVKGDIEIRIKPNSGEAVTIEREDQFSPDVEFLD